MKRPIHVCIVFSSILLLEQGLPAFAHWGKFTITDNNGEEVVVKHGLFGKKTVVEDRWGDGFAHSRSIFGLTKDTKVSALGNDVHVHKGLFGFGKTEGQDMLGDTFTSHKNLLYRNTNVNLSGVNGLMSKFFGPKQVPPAGMPPNATPQVPNANVIPPNSDVGAVGAQTNNQATP